jgi:hypothetical protein
MNARLGLPAPERDAEAPHAYQWLGFEAYVARIAETMSMLVPELRVDVDEDGLQVRRGTAFARIDRAVNGATVVFTQHEAAVLRGDLQLTTKSVYEVTADLVGFFCGASLSTLSLYPHRDPAPVAARPRRWNQRY